MKNITFINRNVNSLLKKMRNPNEMSEWEFYASFSVAMDCPYLLEMQSRGEVSVAKSLIQRMRQKAIIDENMKRELKKPTGEGKGSGDSENTSEGEKPSQNRFTGRQRGDFDKSEGDEMVKMDFNGIDEDFARSFCSEKMRNREYIYTDAKTGYTSTWKGGLWRGKAENTRRSVQIWKVAEKYLPLVKKSVMLTVTPENGELARNLEADVYKLAKDMNRLSGNLRVSMGALVFRVIEFTRGTGIHAHLVIAVCDDIKNFEERICQKMDRMGYSGKYHLEGKDFMDGVKYTTKTNLQSCEEIAEHIADLDQKGREEALNAFAVWYACHRAKVNQFAFPKWKDREKVETRNQNEQKKEIGEEWEDATREKAREIFRGTKCEGCRKQCNIAKWLQQYVYCDNSLPYKQLKDFMLL